MISIELSTVLLHAVFFFAAMFFFTRFALKPLLAVRDARAAATAGKETNAVVWVAEAERSEAQYKEQMLVAKVAVQAIREQAREAGAAQATDILRAARQMAAGQVEAAKADIARQVTEAKLVLGSSAEEFSSLIASRLLERDVRSIDDAAMNESRRVVSIGKAH